MGKLEQGILLQSFKKQSVHQPYIKGLRNYSDRCLKIESDLKAQIQAAHLRDDLSLKGQNDEIEKAVDNARRQMIAHRRKTSYRNEIDRLEAQLVGKNTPGIQERILKELRQSELRRVLRDKDDAEIMATFGDQLLSGSAESVELIECLLSWPGGPKFCPLKEVNLDKLRGIRSAQLSPDTVEKIEELKAVESALQAIFTTSIRSMSDHMRLSDEEMAEAVGGA